MAEAVGDDAMAAASGPAEGISGVVEALREDGAERVDAIRFRFIEALARRGASLNGEARRLVEVRLATAVADCRARLGAAQEGIRAGASLGGAFDGPATVSPLAALVRDIQAHSEAPANPPAEGRAPSVAAAGPRGQGGEGGHGGQGGQGDSYELKSLRYFRKDWSRLGVEQQLARALAQGPRNAGPLNSHGLILQSLQAMRELSPACLERTMAWLDTLLWLDDASAAPTPAPAEKPPPRPAAGRKPKTIRTKAR